VDASFSGLIFLEDFHSPPPEGFVLKTSMEIDLLENKHSFNSNFRLQRKRPIKYHLDNAALATISIILADDEDIRIGKCLLRDC